MRMLSTQRQSIMAHRRCMGRLGGQDGTGACKSKAQPGALLRVGSVVVSFCLEIVGKGGDIEENAGGKP